MPTEAQKRASRKYDKKSTVFVGLKLNKNTDADILERIKKEESMQGFIKKAIREYIKKDGS